ncbi:MAG TPA: serine/threonine-protein kinase [Phycisphaerales bacterium]|nr:serine/threonine-protein kinase [Phycisphaerales bacterium]HMP37187.1 serine/threonine-protein kinase [Phycisphaerales bacterium]
MEDVRHTRLTELFGELRRLAGAVRQARLAEVRAEEPLIAEELEELLRHADDDGSGVLPAELCPVLPEAVVEAIAAFDPAGEQSGRSDGSVGGGSRTAPAASGQGSGRGLGSSSGSSTPRASDLGSRYTVLRQLGEGGMGVVYLAEQHEPKRLVALKVMRHGFGAASERLRKRFHLETQLLARLEHPGIARLYDVGTAEIDGPRGSITVPYFAMEYVDGASLAAHAEAQRLSTRSRMELIATICEAVAAAHRQGIVHRDLKPGNILITRDGRPKVLDFGVARAMDEDLGVTTVQTDAGSLVGTLPYMSPEQVSGDPRAIDARCDVYALGVVAYELLAGQLPVPVRELSIAEAARRIRDDDPAPLSSISRDFRGDFETIVAKALEKDPQRRYPSAAAFGADIRRSLAHEPILARPPSAMYQLRKFARRNRGLVAGLALAFAALFAGLVGTAWGLLVAQRERDAARQAEAEARAERIAAVDARDAEARQREIATRRFDQVRQIAKTFIFEIHDAIVDLPGSTPVRRELLETALRYLDGLAAERGDGNPKLLDEVAEAYVKVGMAQGYHSRGNLGDREAAMASFAKALEIREELARRFPDQFDVAESLLTVRNSIANIKFDEGRYEEALAEFTSVRAERERLSAATDPGSPERTRALRALAISHQWVSNALGALDRNEEALESALAQRALMERLAEPGDEPALRDLAVAHEKIGDRLSGLARIDEAIEAYRESLEVRAELYERMPDNAERIGDYGAALGKIGDRLMLLGRLAEAEPYLRRSHALHARLAEVDPDNVQAQTNLVVTMYRLGRFAALVCAAAIEGGKPEDACAPERLDEGMAMIGAGIAVLEELRTQGRLAARFDSWFEILEAERGRLRGLRTDGGEPAAPAN